MQFLTDSLPQKPFPHKHLLSLTDYSSEDVLWLLGKALQLKAERKAGVPHPLLQGKTLGMIFSKPSARTRISFEVGFHQLGGHALYISDQEIGLGRRESVPDVARVLSRFVDGIMIRTFAQADVEGLAQYGSVPVINGLTDQYHPCQALADLMTFYEHKGGFAGRKLVYVGDGNNVAHSLALACAKVGLDFTIGCPKDYMPDPAVMAAAERAAAQTGAALRIVHDPKAAVQGADAIYTDVWTSMGQEAEKQQRLQDFAGYQVDDQLMAAAKGDCVFMHCLPAHRGEEVAASVIESAASVVFDEAENRLHAQKAVMALLMAD
ncbi:MAG: ornithine carbamoyltransferase [Christensenellales bacterium]|jgi:ornithine carbamoyltransferase